MQHTKRTILQRTKIFASTVGTSMLKTRVVTVFLCSMVAYAAFKLTMTAYSPESYLTSRAYLMTNAYYLGCLHAMQYNQISRKAMSKRCQILTDYYYTELRGMYE